MTMIQKITEALIRTLGYLIATPIAVIVFFPVCPIIAITCLAMWSEDMGAIFNEKHWKHYLIEKRYVTTKG